MLPTQDRFPISRRRAPLTFALVLVALASLPALSSAFAVPSSQLEAPCAVPAAIPNDGRNDRVAIQNALSSKKCAYLPAGKYDIDSIPFTPPARRPYMMLDLVGAQLFGDGPSTVLAFRGSTGGQDWEGISMTGVGSALQDVSIKTGAISNQNEQTHAVRLVGPASDIEISRVSIDHPIRQDEKSGDCIQFVAYNDGREIRRVKIRDNDFLHCDRSGVAVHSGTTGLEISNNRFGDTGNTDLDFEGTGDTNDVLIKDNVFKTSPGLHGVGAIQLQLIDHVRVTGNELEGRGIDVFQSDDVEIDHNEFTFTQDTTVSVIAIGKDTARMRILDNSIARDSSAGAGAVVSAVPHGSGTPDHLEIVGNELDQGTSFHVINTSGVVGLDVHRNEIGYSGPQGNVMAGVRALGSAGENGVRTTGLRIGNNTFSGPLRSAVVTSGSHFGAGTLETVDNIATGPTFGIFCDNPTSQGAVRGPITSTRDRWPAPNCGGPGFVKFGPTTLPVPVPEDKKVDGGGGAGTADRVATPPPAAPDTTAPVLSRVSLSRKTMLKFSSSEAGTLSIEIKRVLPARKGKRATKVVRALTQPIAEGRGSVSLSGGAGVKRMKPGKYRITLTVQDAAGNRSRATLRNFTVPAR
jgi:hypothetical protein